MNVRGSSKTLGTTLAMPSGGSNRDFGAGAGFAANQLHKQQNWGRDACVAVPGQAPVPPTNNLQCQVRGPAREAHVALQQKLA